MAVKKASKAKASVGRALRAGKAAPAGDRRAGLLKELKSLLTELDEEGLDFLLEQAHIHRYNMEVEQLNQAEERRTVSRVPKKGKAAASRKASTPPLSALKLERSKDGETYHVVSGGRYKMFSSQEMLALVRIAHANPALAEAGRGLYRWMSRERTDALADLGIAGPLDPTLGALADLFRKSFAKPPKKA